MDEILKACDDELATHLAKKNGSAKVYGFACKFPFSFLGKTIRATRHKLLSF